MSGRRIFMVVMVISLIIGISGIAGMAGWAQGYRAAVVETGASGEAVAQAAPHFARYGAASVFAPIFFGLGFIFKIGFFFLMLLFLSRLFGFFFWGRGHRFGRGPWGPGGHRGWHPHHHEHFHGSQEGKSGSSAEYI